ncbi:type 1 glutamine amidotransferase domain-containing protein [Chitinivorax sp. B]|uniref:type 1 glutamine amidotransferase domain-containing protein n=1 Tax=Chitinivorax sp. B TaxID=2502235 RepID=UPI0010FA4540|nr:type 1 glutamine amidotransferase domain-containing protein [Chitinivorax sp. B]
MIKQWITAAVIGIGMPITAWAQSHGEVLVVVSSEHQLELKGGKRYTTGYYLNELAVPVQKLIAAGYTPVFANPKGNTPSMDAHSNNKLFFGGDDVKRAATQQFVAQLVSLQKPKKLSAVVSEGTDRYVGIFLPGGHAPMQDLVKDPDLGKILRSFHDSGRPTALLCHAPIALLSTLSNASGFHQALVKNDEASQRKFADGWPYAGYRMTVFSTAEERAVEPGQLKGEVAFYPAEALAEAGGRVQNAGKWKSEVVQDRELITGQQPFSDATLAELFIKALDAQRSAR